MIDLSSPRWKELEHAYGDAADVPALLEQLYARPASDDEEKLWFSLWSTLAHQGDVYSASFAAVPHVVHALASDPLKTDPNFFHLPAWIEICRQKQGIAVPHDLALAYVEALSRLPGLVIEAAGHAWDDDLLVCALAAIAVAKGRPRIAEAILELSPDIVEELMVWVQER